jgi:hypothetical protein
MEVTGYRRFTSGDRSPVPMEEETPGGRGPELVWTISEMRKTNLGPFNP